MTPIVLGLVVFALAYANGANDNFKPCATVYSANTLPYGKALRLATIAQICGSLMSVLLAGTLLKAFSGKGLVPDAVVSDPHFAISVALGAVMAVGFATRLGMPVSTTHALIGGLAGSGLAIAPQQLAWSALAGSYFVPLVLSPFLAIGITGATYPLVSRLRKWLGIEAEDQITLVPISQPIIADHEHLAMRSRVMTLHYEHREPTAVRYTGSMMGVSAQQTADNLHRASAFSLGFARGLNDTPKILGLMIVAGGTAGLNTTLALLGIAVAMAAGGLLHSRRLAETMGRRITTMNPGQGLLTNLVSSGLVIGASLIGAPVSTTHVSTGAIFGIGAWTGKTDWKLVGGIVAAWAATLPLGALCAYAIAQTLTIAGL